MNREREAVIIDYTNWRGERGLRRIIPLTVRFESTEWHPDEQWLLRAIDIEKGVELALAQRDVAIQALNQIAWMDEFLSADAAREMMTIARETLSQLCSPQERGGSDG